MNENKTELILVIARELSDESCAKILERIKPLRQPTMLANERLFNKEDWDESLHPRDKGGQFTRKGFERALKDLVDDSNDEIYKQLIQLPKTPIGQRIQWLQEHLPEFMRAKPGVDYEMPTPESRGGKGQSIVEICQEFVDKAKSEGNDEAVREWTKKLELAKELQSGGYEKKQKKQKSLVKRFHEVEDEMDEIEEAYGDRDKGVGFKWPKTQEADEARKRYRKLKREHASLDKKIDWSGVEED